jgi:hypothetical protein
MHHIHSQLATRHVVHHQIQVASAIIYKEELAEAGTRGIPSCPRWHRHRQSCSRWQQNVHYHFQCFKIVILHVLSSSIGREKINNTCACTCNSKFYFFLDCTFMHRVGTIKTPEITNIYYWRNQCTCMSQT